MKASAITAKINKVAAKYGPFELRNIYKRVVFESGGNTLIDRGVSQTVLDTLFVPQPLFKRATLNPSSSPPPTSNRRDVLAGTSLLVSDEFEFFFTPVQMATADVASKFNIIVLKDNAGNEEQLQLVSYNPVVLKGTEIGTSALYRSVSRGASSSSPGGGSVTRYSFTPAPDGTTTVFTAPVTISANAFVIKNGLVLTSGAGNDYTYSGANVTFLAAPGSTDTLVLYQ